MIKTQDNEFRQVAIAIVAKQLCIICFVDSDDSLSSETIVSNTKPIVSMTIRISIIQLQEPEGEVIKMKFLCVALYLVFGQI